MFIRRVTMRGKATLHELRTVYTLDDLADFHEELDLEDAIAAKQMEKGNH